MELKTLFFAIAFLLVFAAYVPYFRGIFKGETKPHAYTWLIWTITTAIGAAGVWYGGGGLPAITFAGSALMTLVIFFLSFKYGTKNITRSDTIALLVALVAVFIWVGLDNPLWSVIVGVSIDIIGYWPSVRKSFFEPWSESMSAWILWIAGPMFSLLALEAYNPFTTLYYGPIIAINILFVLMCLVRRKVVPKPIQS